jgi:hypothetical protein
VIVLEAVKQPADETESGQAVPSTVGDAPESEPAKGLDVGTLKRELTDFRREHRNKVLHAVAQLESLDELLIRTVDRVGQIEHGLTVIAARLASVTRELTFEQALTEHDLTPAQRTLLRKALAGDKPQDLAAWIAERVAAFAPVPAQGTNPETAVQRIRRIRESWTKG